jgi:kynureninase
LITDIHRVVEAAHQHDALILIDAYHGFGALPIEFDKLGADFMVAGSYKYTRGGPGACFLIIHPRHLSSDGGVPNPGSLFTTDTGWFAKKDPFAYRRQDTPEYASGGDAWLEATPPAIVYAQANPGLELVDAIGMERVRKYSLEQQQLLVDKLNEVGVHTESIPQHGAFILIPTQNGQEVVTQLKANGVNVDARPCPQSGRWLIRLCPDMLNTQAELIEAAKRVGRVFEELKA